MTDDQIQTIALAISKLSHGGENGPLGMEAIVMALGGEGFPGKDSVASGLHDIAGAIRELADTLRETSA